MTVRIGGLVVVAAFLSACPGKSVCASDDDFSSKRGTCAAGVVPNGRLLGDSSTCSTRLAACGDDDQKAVSTALDCYSKLGTCDDSTSGQWAGCAGGLKGLTQSCKDTLFGGVVPGDDGGSDAGVADAGRQPIDDGGHGVSFVAVADERSFAFAWVPLQQAPISSWELNVFDTADGGAARLPEIGIPGGLVRTYELPDAGASVARRFFIAALDSTGQLSYGVVEDAGGSMPVDAGCLRHSNCPTNQVCDLGTCMAQTCVMSITCPQPDYVCDLGVTPHVCLRTGGSMTGIDAGMMMAGPNGRLPMISQSQSVTTGPAAFRNETFLGGFQARRPDMVAIDSARQFVAMEQSGAPVGHFTSSRGRDLFSDQRSASIIDTVGSGVHVAYNAESNVLYACYTVGLGVRVRRSRDFGRTWGALDQALNLEPPMVDDGGSQSSIGDCDIAAWKNGTALMVTVDDDRLVTRQINEILSVNGTPDVAFVSAGMDGGGPFNPRHPSIATLPSANLVHIGFTASRILSGLTDSDIYGVYGDPSTGGLFSAPGFINAPGVMGGSSFGQDGVSVAIDPVTRRGVAVWTSFENTGSGQYTTAYLGFFNNTTKKWITGSDLSVFMTFGGNFPLFPQRTTGLWDAFSPQITTLRDGRVWIMVLAGERQSVGANEIFPYAVEFALDAGSPVGGLGWFRPPAVKMSTTRAADPRGGGNFLPAVNAALAGDSQISIYGAFIEGIGPQNSDENRGVFVTRP